MPALQPVILSPKEGQEFYVGPFHITARVEGGQSGGAFELYDFTLEPSTVDYHVHRAMDETICVISGEIEFVVQGKKFLRPAGSVAFIPRGIHHGFTNHGPGAARVFIHFNPSGSQHEYFRALETLFATTPLDAPALKALQKKYDQELMPVE